MAATRAQMRVGHSAGAKASTISHICMAR